MLGGNGGGGWNYENHWTNLKSFGVDKRKENKLHQNVTTGKVIKPRSIMWEVRTLNKVSPLLNWLQYLKESYLEPAEDLTRTDLMDINCLTFLLGRTLRCMEHFVPFYNKNKKVISIFRNRLRGAYVIEISRVPFYQYRIFFLDVANRQNIFDQNIASSVKTFCKLRDRGFSELNICSKICFLKNWIVIFIGPDTLAMLGNISATTIFQWRSR